MIEALGQPSPRPEEVEDVTGLVAGFVGSALARAASARPTRVHAELPFAFTLDTGGGRSLLVDGIVDVHARGRKPHHEGDGVLVVDYKSDRLEGAEPAERVEEAYAIQRLVYALAALRSGAARAEVAYCFLERPDEPVTRHLRGRRRPARWRPSCASSPPAWPRAVSSPRPTRTAACAPTVPGRPALCSWDEERTLGRARPCPSRVGRCDDARGPDDPP